MTVNERISALRARMRERGMDAYVVFSQDAHQSEYVATHWRCREWLTGFDGSAGTAAITADKAVLWADGRYYIQAAQQISESEFELIKVGAADDGVWEWLETELLPDAVVGFDGRTVSAAEYSRCPSRLRFETAADLIGELWTERPGMPSAAVFVHAPEYAGKPVKEKLSLVRKQLHKKDAGAYLIASLDDIAWLFNLRGGDVPFVPVFYAYAYVDMSDAYLFVDGSRLSADASAALTAQGVIVKRYGDIAEFLRHCPADTLFFDPDRVSVYLSSVLPHSVKQLTGLDITTKLKSVKDETELRNFERVQVLDGVAMVKFIKWVKESVANGGLEEADIHERLLALRGENADFMGASFGTIAAYMSNAASMHYTPVKGKSARLKPYGLLLVDSGGQYLGGTTDITRTLVLGALTDEMRMDFTLTLKAHIALASARFMYGATGTYMDAFARGVMWQHGMDYKSGTGHGVGYFLSVHEGPQRFRMLTNDTRLEPGMITTNEPGVYKEGKWGIRTENILLTTDDFQNADGRFMKFETITYCPVDLAGIIPTALTQAERDWLNAYHAKVYDKLAPHLDDAHRDWLRENTRVI